MAWRDAAFGVLDAGWLHHAFFADRSLLLKAWKNFALFQLCAQEFSSLGLSVGRCFVACGLPNRHFEYQGGARPREID
jgi:hypothetical protein